jgi:hypothetical protein
MTTNETHQTGAGSRIAARRQWPLVAYAAGFLVLYLGSDFFIPNLASTPMPLPNAPSVQTQTWFADNTLAAVLLGVCQLLSVLCLGGFALQLRRTASTAAQVAAARRATPWGLTAVCAMALSSLLAWILAASASGASLGAVGALRTSSFIAGGTAHVVALGIFVLLAARIPGFGKAVRVFAVIAATPALVSLVSLVWFQGAVFILLGRLLCMVWIVCAAVSATRRMARGIRT